MKIKRNCFCCEKELKPAVKVTVKEDNIRVPPSEAIIFTTTGNYGSTIFDSPQTSDFYRKKLHILICDECLVKNQEKVTLLEITKEEVNIKVRKFRVKK